jgi:hypothetical protein
MPGDSKRAKKGGRVTAPASPKGPVASSRYTPPVPRKIKSSPAFVPIIMGVLLAGGAALIIVNYLNLLPGGAKNEYLLVGLGMITAGFVTATQWH